MFILIHIELLLHLMWQVLRLLDVHVVLLTVIKLLASAKVTRRPVDLIVELHQMVLLVCVIATIILIAINLYLVNYLLLVLLVISALVIQVVTLRYGLLLWVRKSQALVVYLLRLIIFITIPRILQELATVVILLLMLLLHVITSFKDIISLLLIQ